jgi:Putative Flp pilus-assembly TadE/G-like
MSTLRNERGQAMVLTVLFLAVLLGIAAAVLDVGAWYRADRQIQATADAAALAGAHALPDSQAEAAALALQYAGKNGGGLEEAGVSFQTKVLPGDTIAVHAKKPMPGFFSKLFGLNSVTVGAKAKARTGVMNAAKWAGPVAVDKRHPMIQCMLAKGPTHSDCQLATELDFDKVGPGAFRLINIDGSHGGTGPPDIGRWINEGLDASMPLGWYYSDPGIKPNSSHIKGALESRFQDTILFPVYDRTKEQGAGFEYEVIGWVGFTVTDYEIQGVKNARIYGHFTTVLWEGIQSEKGGDPDFGARAVTLLE